MKSSLPLAFKIPYKILLIIWIKILHTTRLMTSIAPSSPPPGCVPNGFPPPPDSESVPSTALLLKLFLLLLSSCRVEREKTGFPPPINFSIASNPDSLPDTHSERSLCKSPVSLGPVQQLCCLTAMLRMVAASVISLTKHFLPLTRYSLEAEGD